MQKALSASEEKEERMRQENEIFKKRMESLGKVSIFCIWKYTP